MIEIIKVEDDEPPQDKSSDRVVRTPDCSDRGCPDFRGDFAIFHSVTSRGVAHNLLPLVKGGRYNTFVLDN